MAFEAIINNHLTKERSEGRLSRITRICSEVTQYAEHPNPGTGYKGIGVIEEELESSPFVNPLCDHFARNFCQSGKARTIVRSAMKAGRFTELMSVLEPMLINA